MGDLTHTPGPWEPKTRDEWEGGYDFFSGEDGAFVFMADVGPEDIPLIKAAPELLEALKLALYAVTEIDNSHKSVRTIRNAIAKAEGRAIPTQKGE